MHFTKGQSTLWIVRGQAVFVIFSPRDNSMEKSMHLMRNFNCLFRDASKLYNCNKNR